MKLNDKKVCSTANCEYYYSSAGRPSGVCLMKRLVSFCPEAKNSPEYTEHRRKRQAKWFN
jgi:hypothetical protein